MEKIAREIAKAVMFSVIWVLPVFTVRYTQNNWYFWLFVLSVFGTMSIFGHYEDLEKIDQRNKEVR